jgi:hypothetical protein
MTASIDTSPAAGPDTTRPPPPPPAGDDPFDVAPDFDPAPVPVQNLDAGALVEHLHNLTAILSAKLARRRRIEKLVAAHVERIEAWRLERVKKEQCDAVSLDVIEHAAAGLMLELRRRDPKAKSVSTPWGSVRSRETVEWDWQDEPTLLRWLTDTGHAELVDTVTTSKVAKAAIKRAAVIEDGQVRLVDIPKVVLAQEAIEVAREFAWTAAKVHGEDSSEAADADAALAEAETALAEIEMAEIVPHVTATPVVTVTVDIDPTD